uniref:Uncharacterized protein n=1 Tax=Arundo donax TaxID=35708 RepID=A0A0A8ZFI1_ARUDO
MMGMSLNSPFFVARICSWLSINVGLFRMDASTTWLLHIKLTSKKIREGYSGFWVDWIIDSDTTNFKEFMDDISKKYPLRSIPRQPCHGNNKQKEKLFLSIPEH